MHLKMTHLTAFLFPARDTKPPLADGCLSGTQTEEEEDTDQG